MTTIKEIYAGLNPLPAMLSAKGKIKPSVSLVLEANAGIAISMNWEKRHRTNSYEHEYKTFMGDSFQQALEKTLAFITELPSAEQAKLHEFMGSLGKLIDAGKADGIAVDFMNPLLDTMKRLSENVITFRPPRSPQGSEEANG